jgi:hypothetical protein
VLLPARGGSGNVRVLEEEGNCIVCLEMRADELMRRLISGEPTNYSVVRTGLEPLQVRAPHLLRVGPGAPLSSWSALSTLNCIIDRSCKYSLLVPIKGHLDTHTHNRRISIHLITSILRHYHTAPQAVRRVLSASCNPATWFMLVYTWMAFGPSINA